MNKNMQRSKYKAFDKFILRTPALPVETIENLTIGKVLDLCENPEIMESIYLASPELHDEVIKNKGQIRNFEVPEKLLTSFLKYILRMSCRCTSFGTFSGCSVGRIVENFPSQIIIGDKKISARLDMQYLCSMVLEIEKNSNLRKQLTYYPNNSMYKVGDELRYIEYRCINYSRKHFMVSVDSSIYLTKVLQKAKKGIRFSEMVSIITSENIDEESVNQFINELIDEQVLIKICYKITIKELKRIINFVNDECFYSVQLFLDYDNNYYSDSFCELIVYNHKIQYCIVNNSPESQSIEGKIYFIKKNFSDFSGGVSPNNFVVNIKFFSEAKIANPFFNKKISIMSDGAIKNTPSSPTLYGNIKNENLKEVMRSKEIQFFWYSKKDQIEGCKDCEFRYMCPDDRVPSYKGNDQWFQKTKCNYNPYLSKWN